MTTNPQDYTTAMMSELTKATSALEKASNILAEMKKLPTDKADSEMPWFYPDDEQDYYMLDSKGGGGYEEIQYRSGRTSFEYPVIRTEAQAKTIAWARGEADKWRSTGVMPSEGKVRYFVLSDGEIGFSPDICLQVNQDSIFLTLRECEIGLLHLGGIEHLQKVRRGLWGIS